MRTLATVSVKVDPSRAFRRPGSVSCKIAARRSLLKRFQRFILSTDWERRYFCHQGIDHLCLGVIVLAALFFLPLLAWVVVR